MPCLARSLIMSQWPWTDRVQVWQVWCPRHEIHSREASKLCSLWASPLWYQVARWAFNGYFPSTWLLSLAMDGTATECLCGRFSASDRLNHKHSWNTLSIVWQTKPSQTDLSLVITRFTNVKPDQYFSKCVSIQEHRYLKVSLRYYRSPFVSWCCLALKNINWYNHLGCSNDAIKPR